MSSKTKIAIVVAEFNREVTAKLENGAIEYLKSEEDLSDDQIVVAHVPGAIEIPLVARAFLEKGVDAVIALGAVIRGETTHYDVVCNSVERGCCMLQIQYGKPVTFGVITTENDEQALARAGGNHGNKGRDAAETAMKMIRMIRDIQAQTFHEM